MVYSTVSLHGGTEIVLSAIGDDRLAGTVAALPGWKGSDLGLRGLCGATAADGYRVIALNPPGNGRSPAAPMRVSRLEDLTELMLETLEFVFDDENPAVLLGHSFGATLAAAVAAESPPWLLGLVLVSPVVRAPTRRTGFSGHFSRGVAKVCARLLKESPRTMANAYLRSRLIEHATNWVYANRKFGGALEVSRRSKVERGLLANPRSAGEQLLMAASHGCEDFAAQVECPVEILAGDSDPMSSVAELESLRSELGNARLTLVAGAGHMAHHENAEQFSRLTADCVRMLASRSSWSQKVRLVPGKQAGATE